MKIPFVVIPVNNLDKALDFYTGKLGFIKKSDVSNEGYRWLTVASPEDPDGVELHLSPNDDPALKTFQKTMYAQGQPITMFHAADLKTECDRLTEQGVTFTLPYTEEFWGSMATIDDTCGNLIQLSQQG